MSRRDYAKTPRGKLYSVEWPEWHVECAHEGCGEMTQVTTMGEATTLREAEKIARNTDKSQMDDGWKNRGGLWYCPVHGGSDGR